ncbi:MAG: ABC transporter substrate-binding protein [Paracoccaceae bacterium]|nr:ABC transporter substrate-binding protein [Paracoccaceae bacterium]
MLGLMGGAALAAMLPPMPAFAMSGEQATALIQGAINDVYRVINSGQPPAQMYGQFEAIFARYGDVDVIARTVLGPAARQVSAGDFAAYRQAFQGYVGRKYGRRFRDFIGGQVVVTGARPLKSFYAVSSVAQLRGRAPIDVEWHVSDRSGQVRFFNLIIEGVNMIASERAEIAALLAQRRGNVAALAADLRQIG